jgi:hypothetical protein
MPRPMQSHISHLFTIRMWPEEVGANQIEWRGQARHIPSGQACYFRDWPSLTDFLERTLSGHPSAPQPGREIEDIGDDGPAGDLSS